MATSKKEGATGGPDIRYDAFVRNVRPDPASTEQLVLMRGYIGESTTADRIRLYSDASLGAYTEIPIEDIVHSIPNDDDPLGGSTLWVRQSGNLQYTDPQGYAEGEMYNDYLNNQYEGGGYGAYGGGVQGPQPPNVGQASVINVCLTPHVNFRSRYLICSVPVWQCGIRVTRVFPCITKQNIRTPCRPCPEIPGGFPGGIPGGIRGGGGFMNDPYGGYDPGGEAQYGDYGGYDDYTGGEMYNDYLNNQYEGGGYGAYGGAQITAAPLCGHVSAIHICRTLQINCRSRFVNCSLPVWRCPTAVTRLYCITRNNLRTVCRPCPQTPGGFPGGVPGGIPGGGGFMNDPYGGYGGADPYAGDYGDYTGGEMYDDYLNNQYEGGGYGAYGGGVQAAQTPIIGQASVINVCLTPHVNFRTRPIRLCPIQTVWQLRCQSIPIIRCLTKNGVRTPCRPCPVPTPTPGFPGGGGGFMNDPYGGYGY